jgi:alpha-tubulin suppressor-like RCC1 family protein
VQELSVAVALHGGNRLHCASLAALPEVRCCGTIGSASATWCVPINPFGALPRAQPARVFVGGEFACMLSRGQELYCHGVNTSGQLGSPGGDEFGWRRVSVPGSVLLAAVGEAHGCALLTAGRGLFCWGRNDHGQLGRRENPDFTIPGAVLTTVRGFAPQQLALASASSCALQPDGAVYCWGDNGEGTLGDGTRRDSREPVAVRFP